MFWLEKTTSLKSAVRLPLLFRISLKNESFFLSSDFGLACKIAENFKSIEKKKFAVRWLAPEARNGGTFTVKSDVW
jgi:Protein tyrosine and serine/threonine kinase